jgi:hypothetical protein
LWMRTTIPRDRSTAPSSRQCAGSRELVDSSTPAGQADHVGFPQVLKTSSSCTAYRAAADTLQSGWAPSHAPPQAVSYHCPRPGEWHHTALRSEEALGAQDVGAEMKPDAAAAVHVPG